MNLPLDSYDGAQNKSGSGEEEEKRERNDKNYVGSTLRIQCKVRQANEIEDVINGNFFHFRVGSRVFFHSS